MTSLLGGSATEYDGQVFLTMLDRNRGSNRILAMSCQDQVLRTRELYVVSTGLLLRCMQPESEPTSVAQRYAKRFTFSRTGSSVGTSGTSGLWHQGALRDECPINKRATPGRVRSNKGRAPADGILRSTSIDSASSSGYCLQRIV
jgi:hypothetical protein